MAFVGFLAVLMLCYNIDSAMSVLMKIEPAIYIPAVTPNVTMTCDPDGAVDPTRVQELILIEIIKGELVLGVVRPGVAPRLDASLRTSKYSASGLVDNVDIPRSFLNFYIQFPDETDDGTYQCIVSYMDKDSFLQKLQEDVVFQANATRSVDFQKQLDLTTQTVNNLIARVNTLETQVFNMSRVNANLTTELAALKDRASGRTGFYATLSNKLDVHLNDVLVFNDVQLNDGNGYNRTSGVFVAPVSGLYVFTLVFEVEAPTAVKMDVALQVNGTAISRLFVFGDTSFHGGQASASVVYRIKAGSEVKALVTLLNMETESQPRLVNEALSYFSGFLV